LDALHEQHQTKIDLDGVLGAWCPDRCRAAATGGRALIAAIRTSSPAKLKPRAFAVSIRACIQR
jgi:hypothetical protein